MPLSARPVPLRVKSEYSLGEAIGRPSELVAAASALGFRELALTDVETLAGVVEFHDACRAHGIKPITGVELRVASLSGADSLVVLARSAAGYRALCRVVTALANPHSDRIATLSRHFEDAFVLASSMRALDALLEAGIPPPDAGLLARASTPRGWLDAATGAGARLVFDSDVVMASATDRSVLALVARVFDKRRRRREPPAESGSALDAELFEPGFATANAEIASRCEFDLLDGHVALTARPSASEEASALGRLRALCQAQPAWPHHYEDRLATELDMVARLGLASYFMTAHAVFTEARRRGLSIVTRGSAVSSLIVHRLGLSPIDPLANGLYFERFVRPSRTDPPDIDLELSSARREELLVWLSKSSAGRAAPIAAYARFGRRAAYREGLSALGLSRPEVERFARSLPEEELGLKAPIHTLPSRFAENAPLIERLIGRVSHLSTHPSGVLVAACRVSDFTALQRAPKSVAVTQFDGAALGRLGLPKLDLLGNHCLAELDEVAHWLGRDPAPQALADAATLSLVGRAETVGCHQLETPAMRALLCQLPIESFDDLVAALALIRPAAAGAEAKRKYVARRRDAGRVIDDDPLWTLLPRSYGVVLYEEDVIELFVRLLGTTASEADALRQAVVDRELAAPAFLSRATANGVSPHSAEAAWTAISRFAAYSFSKAHALSAALLAYRSAHAKAHFLPEFACALLNHHGGAYPLRAIGADLTRSGALLLPPDVNRSRAFCTLEAGAVRIGLARISELGAAACERLLSERDRAGAFESLADLSRRLSLPETAFRALLLSGSCDELAPLSRHGYPLPHYAALGLSARAVPAELDSAARAKLELWQRLVRVQNELRYLGLHVSSHPMALLRDEARRAGCLTSAEVAASSTGRVRFAGITSALRRVRQGSRFAEFVTFEDELGLLEAVVSSSDYAELARKLETPGPYLVEGLVRREAGCSWLEVSELVPFHQRPHPYAA